MDRCRVIAKPNQYAYPSLLLGFASAQRQPTGFVSVLARVRKRLFSMVQAAIALSGLRLVLVDCRKFDRLMSG